jgi:hypothetical protein
MNHLRSFLHACAALAVAAGPLPAAEAPATKTPATVQQGAVAGGAWLGLATRQPDAVLAAQLRLETGFGLVVEELLAEGPAGRAGVQVGDVLLRFDDQWLAHPQQLAALVRRHAPGATITLHILRAGRSETLSVVLGARSAERADPLTAPPRPPRLGDDFQRLPRPWGDEDDLDQQMRRLFERLRREGNALPMPPQDEGPGTRWQRSASDGRYTATLSGGAGQEERLEIVDAQGAAQFSGRPQDLADSGLPDAAQRLARDLLTGPRPEQPTPRMRPVPGGPTL